MEFKKSVLFIILVTFVCSLFITQSSQAIPAFARRYKISCTTCHAPFPRLKPYGDEFAGEGFIIQEDEKERDYVTAGDDLLWLNKDFPISVRFDAYAQYDEDQKVDKDLQMPWGLKFMSGGALYKNIGYYFYFYMSERGEVAGIEDAYIHFNNVFKTNLDIMVGQFQTSDPLMKRELRLTFEDYFIYKQHFGLSGTNLAYDRGVMLAYGVEQTGTGVIGMVVNGNGKQEADVTTKFDNDSFKNFGVRINQSIGDFMSIGGFYYTGKEKVSGEDDNVVANAENELSYMGPDFTISIGPIDITAQYLIRKDSNPLFIEDAKEIESKGTVAEVVFSPQLDKSRYYFTFLYNKMESDVDFHINGQLAKKYETATLSGTYLLSTNLRLIAEYTRDLENDLNRMTFGMVSGF